MAIQESMAVASTIDLFLTIIGLSLGIALIDTLRTCMIQR